jgi:DNA-binding beta-propeller fold protein YncE
MKYKIFYLLVIYSTVLSSCKAQQTYGEEYLQLTKSISLPGIKGRIDHLDVNLKEQVVYIAAVGSNALEVVDLKSGKAIHTITGLDEPQGICYIPQHNEIFIANGGTGDCYFYNAATYEKVATVSLRSDADNIVYDSADKKIYVGYGSGGIAMISADTHKQLANVSLPAHPEGIQVDKKNSLLYVNIPGKDMVGVVDLRTLKLINNLTKNYRSGNFPMALDVAGNRLIIGYRHPGKLAIIDTRSGNKLFVTDLADDSDNLFYDEKSKRIYVSCGGGNSRLGYINIFQYLGGNNYKQLANIPTRNGARTSLYVPYLNIFIVAEPSVYSHDGELMIYKIVK